MNPINPDVASILAHYKAEIATAAERLAIAAGTVATLGKVVDQQATQIKELSAKLAVAEAVKVDDDLPAKVEEQAAKLAAMQKQIAAEKANEWRT